MNKELTNFEILNFSELENIKGGMESVNGEKGKSGFFCKCKYDDNNTGARGFFCRCKKQNKTSRNK